MTDTRTDALATAQASASTGAAAPLVLAPPLAGGDVGSFARGVSVVMLYRMLGQAFLLGSTLVAARLLPPEAFAGVALYTSVVSIGSMASSLRLETLAIVARGPARARYVAMAHALNLFVLAAGTVVAAGLLAVLGGRFGIGAWVLLVPLGIYCASLTQFVLPAELSDLRDAGKVGRMTQYVSLATAALQIALPLAWPFAASLIWARLLGSLAGMLPVRRHVRHALAAMRRLGRRDWRRLLPPARAEILSGVPASMLSVFAFQVPVYVFTALGHQAMVGSYWLAFNLMFVPFSILSASFRPLFLRKVAAVRSPAKSYALIARWSLLMTIVGLGLAAGFALGAKLLFVPIVGSKWAAAADQCVWMSVLLASLAGQLPASAASSALGLQRLNLAANVVYLAIRCLAIAGALRAGFGQVETVAIFSIAGAIGYYLLIVVTLVILRRRKHAS